MVLILWNSFIYNTVYWLPKELVRSCHHRSQYKDGTSKLVMESESCIVNQTLSGLDKRFQISNKGIHGSEKSII
jgi:hypothetical protein